MKKLNYYFRTATRRIIQVTGLHSLLWKKKSMRKFLWKKFAQQGELSFHEHSGANFRMSERFDSQTIALFEKNGFNSNDYKGKRILDLGAGSKLRSLFFKEAELFVIEPLAKKFMKLPQSDLHLAKKVYSIPAENRIVSLGCSIDFILCINVLDHCYDLKQVLENIHFYLKKDSVFFLSVDIHEDYKDAMHPISFSKAELFSTLKEVGFVIEKELKTDYEFTVDECVSVRMRKV